MRKIVLYIILGLFPLALLAQSRLEREEIYIGVHGGLMMSMVNFNPRIDGANNLMDPLLGKNGGLVFRYSGHRCCGLQVEVNYLQRGWQEDAEATALTPATHYERQLDYIEVPFLSHIYFGSESFRGFVNLGPQVGYCFASQERGERQSHYEAQYEAIKKPFDWGVAGGLGLYFRNRKVGIFQVEARFDYSFGHLFPVRRRNYFKQINTMDLSVNFGYLFEIK